MQTHQRAAPTRQQAATQAPTQTPTRTTTRTTTPAPRRIHSQTQASPATQRTVQETPPQVSRDPMARRQTMESAKQRPTWRDAPRIQSQRCAPCAAAMGSWARCSCPSCPRSTTSRDTPSCARCCASRTTPCAVRPRRCSSKSAAPRSSRPCSTFCGDAGFQGRVEALDILVSIGRQAAIPALSAALEVGSLNEKLIALQYLGNPELMAKDVRNALRAITRRADPRMERVALQAIAAFGALCSEDEYFESVAPLLDVKSLAIVRAAIEAINRFSSPRAVGRCSDASCTPDPTSSAWPCSAPPRPSATIRSCRWSSRGSTTRRSTCARGRPRC